MAKSGYFKTKKSPDYHLSSGEGGKAVMALREDTHKKSYFSNGRTTKVLPS